MKIRYLQLSQLIGERLLFSRMVYETYNLIEFISKDYQHFSEWYWTKAVPWIFNGQMDFFLATADDTNVVGILIAKKEQTERKICTLFVKPAYSNNGIGSSLVIRAFEYLETTTPIITFTDYKLQQFESLMKKFDWKVTKRIFKPYNGHFELICNTTL